MMSLRFAFLFALLLPTGFLIAQEKPVVSEFVRYLKPGSNDPNADSLQTAITRFTHAESGHIVDLVSVIHIADRVYYEALNDYLAGYDDVFFEMVGGNSRQMKNPANNKRPRFAQSAQQEAIEFLGLEIQGHWINYDRENFVHADMSWNELYDLMDVRNQSLTTIFRNMNKRSGSQGGQLLKSAFLGTLIGGNPEKLKRALAIELSDAEQMIARMEGESGTVLVSDRNAVVMQKLDASLATADSAEKTTKSAILYGAAHMPDFASRLENRGFKETATKWVTAWRITSRKSAPASTPEDAAMQRYLKSLSSGDPGKIDAARFFEKSSEKSEATDP